MRFLRRLVSAIRGSSPSPGSEHSRVSLSYSDRIRAIHELDTGFIHHRLVHIDWLERSLAHKAIKKYKELLVSALDLHLSNNLNPSTLRPDPLTDTAWHAHVLHTKRYRDDCMRILGFYLEHIPDSPRELRTSSHLTSSRRRREESNPGTSSSSCGGGVDIPLFHHPLSPSGGQIPADSKGSHDGDIGASSSSTGGSDAGGDGGGSSCGGWGGGGWCGGWD